MTTIALTALALIGLLALAGCETSGARLTVLLGATTVVAPGAQPIQDSVIVIAEGRIRSLGMRKDVPIPQNSDRVDLKGRWIVPASGARIAIAEKANLLILANPPNDVTPASARDVQTRMAGGEWVR